MTNTMKIYENGKLVEVVRRPARADFAPKARVARSVRVSRLKRNKVGSNQYRTKRHENWHTTLLVGFILVALIAGISWTGKNVIAPKISKAFAQEEAGKSAELISPIPDPTSTPKPTETPKPSVQDLKEDRVKKTYKFLHEKKSPLANHADYIVTMADKYDIPWTLVTAIAGKESSFETAGDTTDFNAWGIMTWDSAGNRSIRKFANWEESIKYATALLSKHYRADSLKAIQEKYCPSFECSNTWVSDVKSFQEDINE